MNRREETAAKLRAVRAWLDERSLEGVLLASVANFAWLTAGGHSHVAVAEPAGVGSILVTPAEAYLLTSNIELRRLLDEEVGTKDLVPVEWPWHEQDGPRHALEGLGDPTRMAADLSGFGPRVTSEIAALRYTLLEPEIDRYRSLGQDCAVALEIACREASPGDSELDVAARTAHECMRRDIQAVVNLVAADERIALRRHPLPTAKRIRKELMGVVTGRRHGLHASLTRMVSFAGAGAELESRHRAVARVDARMILESRPGNSLNAVFGSGLDQYAEEGFPEEWKLHHQGGLTGYGGREVFATLKSEHRLKANQVVAWNPSIARVKSEDTVLVGAGGPEVLTRSDSWPNCALHLSMGEMQRPTILEK